MNWIEQIQYLCDHPEVTWSGAGGAVLSIFLSMISAAALWFISRFRKPKAAAVQQDASEWLAKNRHKLRNIFQEELDTRLHSFLLGKEPLELDKTLAPQEVDHPHSLQDSIACTLERDGVAVETTGQPITALFNRPDVSRRLAILGEPGSGKTVCLLKLCGHLLHEAERDESAPLPVIFECSEWDSRDLLSWMAWQLHRRCSLPEDTARQLVQAGDIFPLFDGLDELATERQRDFVRAFNVFAEGRSLVLCCRLEEYHQLRESAGQKLVLSNAAILQDIPQQKLKGHLYRQGLDALWNQIEHSENLLRLAQRPLFLGLMIAVADELRQGSRIRQGETWEDCIWRLYLNDCLAPTRPDHGRKCNKEQSLHWLRCLARWMRAEQKVELRTDELQPRMLKGYWRFGLLYGLFVGLLMGLMVGLFTTPVLGASVGLVVWLVIGLIIYLSWKWSEKITIAPLRPLRLPVSWQNVKRFSAKLACWLIIGLAFGPLVGLVLGFVKTGKITLGARLACGLAWGLVAGFLYGLAEGLKAVAGPLNETAHPHQRLHDALRSSLLLFPFFVLAALLLFVQVLFSVEQLGIAVGPFFNMQVFYLVLFAAAILSFWVLGTDAVLQHYLLRLCLRWEGQLPLRLVPWLEAMHQRKVLQQVGGSYHFLHKQLQEYLAKQMEMEERAF